MLTAFIVTLIRLVYSGCFFLLLPLVFLRLLWRSRLAPEYRKRWLERLGILDKANLKLLATKGINMPIVAQNDEHMPVVLQDNRHTIWVHAVSLGEVIAATPVIKALQQQYPHYLLVVTTTTITGSAQVKKIFADSVLHVYLPYDLPWCVAAFLRKINPKICVILETELWPNILQQCWRRNIPVTIINARLSPKSVKRYEWIKWYLRADVFNKIYMIAAQSAIDRDRFMAIGAPEVKITIAGNIKFDLKIVPEQRLLGNKLRASWGKRPVWIAASTHEGEEVAVLAAFRQIQAEFIDALLVLVPRHPERCGRVEELLKNDGYKFVCRTATNNTTRTEIKKIAEKTETKEIMKTGEIIQTTSTMEVFLVDTIGELGIFYQTADVAFVGGSLVPIGGHNVLEAAVAAIPIVTGSYMDNCLEIRDKLIAAQALQIVDNADKLADTVKNWFRDTAQAAATGARARSVVNENSGATQKVLDIVDNLARSGNTSSGNASLGNASLGNTSSGNTKAGNDAK